MDSNLHTAPWSSWRTESCFAMTSTTSRSAPASSTTPSPGRLSASGGAIPSPACLRSAGAAPTSAQTYFHSTSESTLDQIRQNGLVAVSDRPASRVPRLAVDAGDAAPDVTVDAGPPASPFLCRTLQSHRTGLGRRYRASTRNRRIRPRRTRQASCAEHLPRISKHGSSRGQSGASRRRHGYRTLRQRGELSHKLTGPTEPPRTTPDSCPGGRPTGGGGEDRSRQQP
jgi:hypothetical protein